MPDPNPLLDYERRQPHPRRTFFTPAMKWFLIIFTLVLLAIVAFCAGLEYTIQKMGGLGDHQ